MLWKEERKVKTIFKKIPLILLTLLVGFGTGSTIIGNGPQNATNNKYVLSNYFSRRNLVHSLPTQQQLPIQQLKNSVSTINLPANTEKSSNWAGYIDTPTSKSSSYTSISGSWTIPNIPTNKQNAVAAQWIGLGGASSSDLLQMGTLEEVENGQAVAEIFWEKLPDVSQNIISVPINSTINVSISKSSNSTWNLTFAVTEPNGRTQTKTISTTLDSSYEQGIGTSAEWISEDPSNDNNQLYPLADMGTVKYQSAMVNGDLLNASSNKVNPVAMESSNENVVIYPSTIGTDGGSFTTTTNLSLTSRQRLDNFPRSILRDNSSRIHPRQYRQ